MDQFLIPLDQQKEGLENCSIVHFAPAFGSEYFCGVLMDLQNYLILITIL